MRILFCFLTTFLSIAFSNSVMAEKRNNNFSHCFIQAADRYQIDHRLLIAIAEVESSMNPRAIGQNKRNGKVISEDVGLMQINSSWFPLLEKMGVTRDVLIENPCQNIFVGAWILAKNISANGVNWESVGAYNAGFKNANAPFRQKYAKKVYARYLALTGEG